MNPADAHRRHVARQAAVQMLYQWEVGHTPIEDVVATYWRLADASPGAGEEPSPVPAMNAETRAFAIALATGVASRLAEIDPLIAGAAKNWRLERMAVLDRLILRLAVYEFLHGRDTPRIVVIDEAVELAKRFSGDEAGGFVNGVLDAIHRRIEEENAIRNAGA